MPGKDSQLNARAAHKQLLIAESEVQRILLAQDAQVLTDGIKQVSEKVGHAYQMASSAASAASAITNLGSGILNDGAEKHPFLQKVMNGFRMGTSLWKAFKNGES